MNMSTTLTLNDRFSMIKTPVGVKQEGQRGRARSRSQGHQASLRGSTQNRRLLAQLDKQHKMRLALKLKNKSIVRSRGRQQGQLVRNNIKRATAIKRAVDVRNFKRANSLTTFVPLNDGPRRNFRGRSRSQSRGRSQTRGNSQQRGRSNSRGRVQQTGSITDRLGVRQPRRRMRRSGNFGNGGQQQQQRSRSRPQSRVRLNRNNFASNVNNNRNANARNTNNRNINNQRAALKRSNSVNARLGNNNVQNRRQRRLTSNVRNQNTQLKKPLAGRIVKRTQRKPVAENIHRNIQKNGNALNVNGRRGKISKRGGGGNVQGQARGRARNRGPNQAGNQGQPAARRGRSRTRRGANNSRGGGAKGPVSKEQLDKQLDDYMSKGGA